jgi:F0F1-type ATP synthase assembly protein I
MNRATTHPPPKRQGGRMGHPAEASRERGKMPDEKPEKREESPLVAVARYSEIGFMIPAAVFVGYGLGLGADHLLHTHWIYLFGIVFGAVAGFVSMIRRALQPSAEDDKKEKDGSNGGH